jgi:drug/metabolite transporter (DMT)-like permease
MTEELRMGKREWAMLALLSLLWGGSFFFIKVMVTQIPPLTMMMGRVAIAAAALNAALWVRGTPLPRGFGLWRSFIVVGLINNVIPFTLIAFGETRVSSALAAILIATTPVFTVLIAHLVTRNERLTRSKLLGVLFGLVGVAVLIGPRQLRAAGGFSASGELCCLLAALTYAFAAIYGRRFKSFAPLAVATGQLTASTLVLLPLSLAIDRPWSLAPPGLSSWLALAGIALFSTALAYLLYFRILAAAGATNVALVTLLVPISTLLLGASILGERLSAAGTVGMLLIGVGLAAIDGRPFAALSAWLRARFGAHPGHLHDRVDD